MSVVSAGEKTTPPIFTEFGTYRSTVYIYLSGEYKRYTRRVIEISWKLNSVFVKNFSFIFIKNDSTILIAFGLK